jgi:hypothetical protein
LKISFASDKILLKGAIGRLVAKDRHLEKICIEFAELEDEEKDYILGITQSLAFFIKKKDKKPHSASKEAGGKDTEDEDSQFQRTTAPLLRKNTARARSPGT